MASGPRFAAFFAANAAAVAAVGFFGLPRLATHAAPAALTNAPAERVVHLMCPLRSPSEREQVLRTL